MMWRAFLGCARTLSSCTWHEQSRGLHGTIACVKVYTNKTRAFRGLVSLCVCTFGTSCHAWQAA